MQPTPINGLLLGLLVFAISYAVCYVASRRLGAHAMFCTGYTLLVVPLIVMIPSPLGESYLQNIDAQVSFWIIKGLAIVALGVGVLFGLAMGQAISQTRRLDQKADFDDRP